MLARGLLLLSAAAASTVLAATSSSGCGKDAPYKLKKLSPAWIESDNNNRTFYVNLPSSYDSNTAVPLILSYHGNGRSAKEQVSIDQFTNETWNPNSIVVYPEMDGVSLPYDIEFAKKVNYDANCFRHGKWLRTPTVGLTTYNSLQTSSPT